MKTKSFVLKLNQITTAFLSMTPALREAVHQSIRTSQVEMPINELFQPIFDASPSCTHCASAHLKKWGSQVKHNGIDVIIALRPLILR
jgi:hypothetical protein